MTTDRPHRFAALDGWRGICALLVALHHLNAHGHFYSLPLVRNAWLFVDFFFVLSGFVIAHAYGRGLQSASQIRDFTLRRFARLWPLHVTILAAFITLEAYRFAATGSGFTGERSLEAIFTNLSLIQSLGIHDGLTWNTPAWSISTEFYTYLAFASVCALTAARVWRIALSAGLMFFGLAVLLLFSRYGMRETFGFGFFRCLYGFFAGTLIYEIWKAVPARWSGSIWEVAVLAIVAIFVTFAPHIRALEYFAVPVFAFAVFVFAQQAGAVSRVMESRAIGALGRWSYSIYMVHMLVIALGFSALDALGKFFHQGWTVADRAGSETVTLGGVFDGDLTALVYLAIVIALSAFTWRFVELPGQRLFVEHLHGKIMRGATPAR
jgi:peptidoglycan/LPS O-acetylase OafA/YrhL